MSNFTAPAPVRRAESEIATLLAACIDYRTLLIRAQVPDSVSGRVEDLMTKYRVALTPRSEFGEKA